MDPEESESEIFAEYRGSLVGPRDLPWIDVEKALLILCNKWPGDDVGIAIDYRPGLEEPRVIGGDWHSGERIEYRDVSATFPAFVEMLGL